jgi:CheY-like chemotaxis protein
MAGERILIVEDRVATEGNALKKKIQSLGYQVLDIAETEGEAIEIAKRERPAVVLMDIKLPNTERRLDDYAGIRAARTILAATGAQIIFITSYFEVREVIAKAQQVGVVQLLAKPATKKQLQASIRLALERANRKDLVFVCYARRDHVYADEITKYIRALEGIGIQPWVDTDIDLGRDWEMEIARALSEAKAAVCLVSIDFISSEYIRAVELPKLLKAADEKRLCLIPVFIGPVDVSTLERAGLLRFQGLNQPDSPIAPMPKSRRQQCWANLSKRLQSIITRFEVP